MKTILVVAILLSSSAFAEREQCSSVQKSHTLKASLRVCQEHLKEFADRSSATCIVQKSVLGTCWASCKDESGGALAKIQIKTNSDCGREMAYFSKTIIQYYR